MYVLMLEPEIARRLGRQYRKHKLQTKLRAVKRENYVSIDVSRIVRLLQLL